MNTITCKGSWKQQLIQAKQHLIAERLTPEQRRIINKGKAIRAGKKVTK